MDIKTLKRIEFFYEYLETEYNFWDEEHKKDISFEDSLLTLEVRGEVKEIFNKFIQVFLNEENLDNLFSELRSSRSQRDGG